MSASSSSESAVSGSPIGSFVVTQLTVTRATPDSVSQNPRLAKGICDIAHTSRRPVATPRRLYDLVQAANEHACGGPYVVRQAAPAGQSESRDRYPHGTGPKPMTPHPNPNRRPRMRTVRTVVELREALAPARREGRTIGLVPTMGALHDGHLSLVHHARERCDLVVVSLFVNPAQFNERSDLERYPRDEHRDAEIAAKAGADVLFAPSVEEVYPQRVRNDGRGPRRHRAPRGSGPRRRTLPRRQHRRHQAALHGAPRRRIFRPEGRPAGGRHPPPRARPEPAGADRGAADRARA